VDDTRDDAELDGFEHDDADTRIDRADSEPTSGDAPAGEAADRLIGLLGVGIDELRSLAEEATSRWRGDRIRVGEGTKRRLLDVARELGLVTREEWDELELRVAQLEHRLRLVERDADQAP
jgi:polyhydroxyalkanoate synthesis regulator phasin